MTTLAVSFALASMAAAGATSARPVPEPVSTAAFAHHAKFLDAQISPSGKYLALVAVEGGRRSLVFMDLGTRKFIWGQKPDGQTMIGSVHWVNDERVVAELIDQDSDLASPVSRGELYAVNATGTNGMKVYGYRSGEMQTGSNIRKAELAREWAFFLDGIPNDTRNVVVRTMSWDEIDRFPQVYKLDVYTGLKRHVTGAPVPEASFATDENGEPRIAAALGPGLEPRVFYRATGETWRELRGMEGLGPEAAPVGFVTRDRIMYATGRSPGGFGLFAVPVGGGPPRLLVENAIVPPRVCASGASFGAYAAVQAAILAPDLFRCVVGLYGVYDLTRLGASDDFVVSQSGRGYTRTAVGSDVSALRRASPVYNAGRIRARVLIIHGQKDRRAPMEHATSLRMALEAAGNAPEWLVEPNEGHGFYDEGARERMYSRVVSFLRENTAPHPGAAAAGPAKATGR